MLDHPADFPSVRLISCGLKTCNNYLEDKAARDKIVEILGLKKNPIFQIYDNDVDITLVNGFQATVWAFISSTSIDTYNDKNVNLYYGYIKGDEFWYFRHAFESSIRWVSLLNGYSGPLEFVYPLEWLSKKEFTSWYTKHDNVFQNLSWGGDTKTIKLKEKDELEFLHKELLTIYNKRGENEHEKGNNEEVKRPSEEAVKINESQAYSIY